jgi:hypothetical protein
MFRKVAAAAAAVIVVGAGTGTALAANGPPGRDTCPNAGTCVPKLDGTGPRADRAATCVPRRDGTGTQAGRRARVGLRVHAPGS